MEDTERMNVRDLYSEQHSKSRTCFFLFGTKVKRTYTSVTKKKLK